MERVKLLEAIKPRMPEKRYIHTIGVTDTAIELAKLYGEDEKKVEVAAILHDIAKYADVDWMKKIVRDQKLDARLLDWGSEILHGPVGAYIAQSEFHINDEDILNAMRYHTTGRANMSQLEKIVFIADMIEPNRKFDGVEELRLIARENLDEALRACIQHSLAFLVATRQPIFPQSIECYNDYMREE